MKFVSLHRKHSNFNTSIMAKLFRLHSISILAAGVILLTGCNNRLKWHETEGVVWNTTYRIAYEADRPLDDSIQAIFRQVESSLSAFSDNSLISRINRGETDSVDCDLCRVFEISKDVNRLSGGMFDPSVAPLVNLWGFGTDRLRRAEAEKDSAEFEVSAKMIADALLKVGIDSCHIENGRLKRKHDETTFNFSAVAKGYGCDLISEMLLRNGSENHIVEIGGEIALSGHNRKGNLWRIQIDAPVETSELQHEPMSVIEVGGSTGIATSGNYRNFHTTAKYGKFGHTISPVSGYPAESDVVSATVVAPCAALADAWATACMAMNADSAMQAISRLPDVECLIVTIGNDSTLTIKTSPGFPKILSAK